MVPVPELFDKKLENQCPVQPGILNSKPNIPHPPHKLQPPQNSNTPPNLWGLTSQGDKSEVK